ncbi:MAG: type III pantothenate kinase [Pseudanabaena sp. M090S1SP1A06QC]|jgi:type III pantothenate kinase|nr:type III pantothenate kinase [Pseudanabaena sp. M051S1SP1A06QC]MCA6605202.1 type III pantothenate kinase [Pseudanabaena sp. M007S1SP1A06QC]MCA6615835.1 type III pantothenate kinase [Pseudanabaena sp. M090S1SP1A06QC]MCE2977985.1 type III pantothenate kinase [Pseudanabaena sp. CoA8_M7]
MSNLANYLAIAIGNTRIKAVIFGSDRQILEEYAFTHDQLPVLEAQLADRDFAHIAIASVVPELITNWHHLPQTQIIKTCDVPLRGLYATMGCDRALAAYGAGETYGYPVLVIDAGTAIDLTGINDQKTLVGGAIVAGLRSQFLSLYQNTSALPDLHVPTALPNRWGIDTNSSIQAGISQILLTGLQAYINDWRSQFPDSKVIITGGDGEYLVNWGLQVDIIDKNLIFWGIWELS